MPVRTASIIGLTELDSIVRIGDLHDVRNGAHGIGIDAALIAGPAEELADAEPALTRTRTFGGSVPPLLAVVGVAGTKAIRKHCSTDRSRVWRVRGHTDRVGAAVQARTSIVAGSVEYADAGRGGSLQNRIDAAGGRFAHLILAGRPAVTDDRDAAIDHRVEDGAIAGRLTVEGRFIHGHLCSRCERHDRVDIEQHFSLAATGSGNSTVHRYDRKIIDRGGSRTLCRKVIADVALIEAIKFHETDGLARAVGENE